MRKTFLIAITVILCFSGCDKQTSKEEQTQLNKELFEAVLNNEELNDKIDMVSAYYYKSPLLQAILNVDNEKINFLLENGTDIKEVNFTGKTALEWAVILPNMDTINILLNYNADINAKNESGISVLMYAAINNHQEIVKLLISAGAEINTINNSGRSILIMLVMVNKFSNEHKEMIKLFIDSDININIKDLYGNTALSIAKENDDIAQLLIDAGATE